MLLIHCVRAAASRTFWTAGTSRAIKIAMIAITTSNSISVKAPRRWDKRFIKSPPDKELEEEILTGRCAYRAQIALYPYLAHSARVHNRKLFFLDFHLG